MNEKKTYSYSYSADKNKEIKRIREKYIEPDERETKLEQIRRLDASVHNRSALLSLVVGLIGALILGFGLSCILVYERYVAGIPVGIIGIILAACAYPVYKIRSEKIRKEIAPVIIKLTDELIK